MKDRHEKLIIYAPSVHEGGGLVLLDELLKAIDPEFRCILLLNSKVLNKFRELPAKHETLFFDSSLKGRVLAEFALKNKATVNSMVICFGNFPPIFSLQGHVVTFVQNRSLVQLSSLLPFKSIMNIWLRHWGFRLLYRNTSKFVVQTISMKHDLLKYIGGKNIEVIPYIGKLASYQFVLEDRDLKESNEVYDFIYPASGLPHKNHKTLIEAWCIMASEDIYPKLCLTLDRKLHAELYEWVLARKQSCSLQVDMVGIIPRLELWQLYNKSKALIYPSLLESFGLPLIEAQQVKLPILAAELDYVRDLVQPKETFDPTSALSIARAVKRFLSITELLPHIFDAGGFLKKLMDDATI